MWLYNKYMYQVPANLNENQLLDEFEQFGEVETLKVVTQRNRRYAYIYISLF